MTVLVILAAFSNPWLPEAGAATEVATGTNPAICDQIVSSITGVVAERISQECLLTFTNTTEITWTVPQGVSNVSAIIVGGGGGGGDSSASATGGGGGAGGFFQNTNIYVTGDIAIKVGAGGTGVAGGSQGTAGGTSYIGTLKVGGGGGGNGYSYAGGVAAGSGVGGADFVSSGSGGGGRSRNAGTGNEKNGGLAGSYAASGVSFLGITYLGLQGSAGGNASSGDLGTGGLGGSYSPASDRTSSISGASVIYSKVSDYLPWGHASSTAGTKTSGSGGSPNYGYGTDGYSSGSNGSDGIVIIRYAIAAGLDAPTFSGELNKGLWESVTVTLNIAGKLKFYFDGKIIPTCKSVSQTGSSPVFTATCTWKPTVTGKHYIYAVLTPTDASVARSTSAKTLLSIVRRVNTR